MSCDINIDLKLNIHTAAAVRQSLFTDIKGYTYDPTCCPQRVIDIREAIVSLDEQIEEALKEDNEKTD